MLGEEAAMVQEQIRICIAGACGRMGQRLLTLAAADETFVITGALERADHPSVGKDISATIGLKAPLAVTSDVTECFANCDVMTDFTTPESTLVHLEAAGNAQKAMVIGTTGLTGEQSAKLQDMATRIPAVVAANMSLGVNALFALTDSAAQMLGEDFDLEIVEAHHRLKKDAPSGTARRLAEILAERRGLKDSLRHGREGIVGVRPEDEIGVHAVRGGDIVGEHTVLFAGMGERIELTHRAHSRDTFVRGALVAAKFIVKQKPGIYNMQQVLGLK
jgi:4-hydroxy-tetrahydrodipicolinate reductase